MERVACNLCGSTEQQRLYRMPDVLYNPGEWFDVVECARCGLGFVSPRPTPHEMARFYPPAFHETLAREAGADAARLVAQAEYVEQAAAALGGRRLLDVGCANGDFMAFMRARGWEPEGVEPFGRAEIAGPRVFREPLPTIPLDAPTYEVVTAWAVLEHVHDPKAYFMKVARILTPGGAFAFTVPNFASLASRSLFFEDVPRHLYFFTKHHVRQYSELAGLRLERVDQSNRAFVSDPHRALQYLWRRVRRAKWEWPPPLSYHQFLQQHRLHDSFSSVVRFGFSSPLSLLDRAMAPLLGLIERWLGRYATSVYVVRKPV